MIKIKTHICILVCTMQTTQQAPSLCRYYWITEIIYCSCNGNTMLFRCKLHHYHCCLVWGNNILVGWEKVIKTWMKHLMRRCRKLYSSLTGIEREGERGWAQQNEWLSVLSCCSKTQTCLLITFPLKCCTSFRQTPELLLKVVN